ncbi:putative glycosyltransferase EpsJ [compost metagenome]
MIDLSIIIAAYNVETFIEKCVLSCISEKLQDRIEIVVVDDGSTDQTLQKILELKEAVSNLIIIQQKNMGLGASRNIGLQKSKGKYVWMIDGDDYVETHCLDSIVAKIQDDLDVYCFNYNISDDSGKVLYKAYPNDYLKSILSGAEYYKINYEKNYTWQYVFRKDLFLKNNISFKERINMQDSEILPKILYHATSVEYLDLVGYNYVQYQNSFTNTQDAGKRFKYFQSIIEVRDSLFQFGEGIKTQNEVLYSGIQKKIQSLNQVVFNHLVFFKYEREDFEKNIKLLKLNGFFPLKAEVSGKMKLIKFGINKLPLLTNFVLSSIRK